MGILQGFKNLIYIAAEKLKNAFIRVRNAMTRFFEKALCWMKETIAKLARVVKGVLRGAAHFYRKKGDKYQEGTRNYSLDEEIGEWNETVVVREITLDDIPPQYRNLGEGLEIDDTKELDAELVC